MAKKQSITHQQMNAMNWWYKKQTPPTDENAHLNGEVKVIKPPKSIASETVVPSKLGQSHPVGNT